MKRTSTLSVLSTLGAWVAVYTLASSFANSVEGAEITEITEDNVNETFAQNDPLVVMFYAPWCGKCRKMEPEFGKAVNRSEEEGMPFSFGRIHADEQADLCVSFGVASFPAFLAYFNGSIQRLPMFGSAEALLTFLRKTDNRDPGSSAKKLDTLDDAGNWLFWRGTDGSKLETTMVGAFPPGSEQTEEGKKLREVFDQVSHELVMYMRFAEIQNSELIETLNMPTDKASVAMYKDFDEGKNMYAGNADAAELKDWIQRLSTPLVTTVDHWELQTFHKRGNVLVHVFVPESTVEDGPALQNVKDAVRKVAEPLENEGLFTRGQFTFAVTNGEKYQEWLKPFGLVPGRLPAFGLANLHGGRDPDSFEFFSFQVTKEETKNFLSTREEQTPMGETYYVEEVTLPVERAQNFVRDFVNGKLKSINQQGIGYDVFSA